MLYARIMFDKWMLFGKNFIQQTYTKVNKLQNVQALHTFAE